MSLQPFEIPQNTYSLLNTNKKKIKPIDGAIRTGELDKIEEETAELILLY